MLRGQGTVRRFQSSSNLQLKSWDRMGSFEKRMNAHKHHGSESSENNEHELPQIPKYFEIGDNHRGECKFDENAIFDEKNKKVIEALS